MVGGWAFVGCVVDPASGERFASLQACRDYVSFVKSKATPLTGRQPPLSLVKAADEETRTLWAEAMHGGCTLEAKVAALWLFAHRQELAEAQEVTRRDGFPSTPKGKRNRWAASSEDEAEQKRLPKRSRQNSQGQQYQPKQVNLQKRQGNQNSQHQQNQQFQQKAAVAKTTAKGKEICGMFNDGKCA